ncbi:HalOD1 output domain-containing protein [Halosimplex salinum]|uniref:HalOD1 output domain-containing protein n=1 Tax=Halosimplex salinum TaxID=1710538 RepID=UPI000F477A1B|nr:HalOD1 output domain-containing protein [Halosimplex salinum]
MSQAIRAVDESGQGFVTADISDEQRTSRAVVETVATIEGIESTELTAQLHDSVDPEALDSLYHTSSERSGPLRVTFTFAGYEIVVVDGQRVTVRERSEDRSP